MLEMGTMPAAMASSRGDEATRRTTSGHVAAKPARRGCRRESSSPTGRPHAPGPSHSLPVAPDSGLKAVSSSLGGVVHEGALWAGKEARKREGEVSVLATAVRETSASPTYDECLRAGRGRRPTGPCRTRQRRRSPCARPKVSAGVRAWRGKREGDVQGTQPKRWTTQGDISPSGECIKREER